MTPMSTASGRAHVELRLPADSAFVSVLRTASAGLAARLDFTLDDIEDLRMAVGEACAIVLSSATEGDLRAEFWLGDGQITVRVSAPGDVPVLSPEEDFGWQVLRTLATETGLEHADGANVLTLVVTALSLEAGD
jgi:serine/threonine-protein kinase RsbW